MKRLIVLIMLLAFALCACGDDIDKSAIGEFSFSDDWEYFTSGDMLGVRTENFVNTGGRRAISARQAVKLAREEFDSWRYEFIRLAYDSDAEVWQVYFHILGSTAGMSVYLDSHGRTLMTVTGE